MKKNILFWGSIAIEVLAIAFAVVSLPSMSRAEGEQVGIVKNLLAMPGNGYFTNGDTPIIGVRWVDGYFVVAGFCTGTDNSKGLWAFSEAGTAAGMKDQCRDIGENNSGSTDHAWSVSPNIQPVGGGGFVKEMSGNNNRPPAYYQVSGAGLAYTSKAYSHLPITNGTNRVDNIAAVPGYAVALKNNQMNVVYSLPNWNVTQETSATFIPITGVGEYVVGTPTPGNSGLVVYRITNGNLQMVGNTPTGIRPVAAAVDVASQGTKVGFLFLNDGGRNHVAIYSVGATGLTLVRDVSLPATAIAASTGWQGGLAISGDNVAFVDSGLPALPLPPSGTSDNLNSATVGLAVIQGNSRMTVQRLPYETAIGGQNGGTTVHVLPKAINGIAISPSGNIVVTSYFGAYLYKIGGGGGPVVIPTSTLPTTSTPPVLPSIPGQGVLLTLSTSSPNPEVLMRFANVLSLTSSTMNVSLFGQEYAVDIRDSSIVGSNWARISLNSFLATHYANVWGYLDINNPALIKASRVRNPIPWTAGAAGQLAPTQGTGAGNGTGNLLEDFGGSGSDLGETDAPLPPIPPTNQATTNSLDAIQRLLESLRARLGG